MLLLLAAAPFVSLALLPLLHNAGWSAAMEPRKYQLLYWAVPAGGMLLAIQAGLLARNPAQLFAGLVGGGLVWWGLHQGRDPLQLARSSLGVLAAYIAARSFGGFSLPALVIAAGLAACAVWYRVLLDVARPAAPATTDPEDGQVASVLPPLDGDGALAAERSHSTQAPAAADAFVQAAPPASAVARPGGKTDRPALSQQQTANQQTPQDRSAKAVDSEATAGDQAGRWSSRSRPVELLGGVTRPAHVPRHLSVPQVSGPGSFRPRTRKPRS